MKEIKKRFNKLNPNLKATIIVWFSTFILFLIILIWSIFEDLLAKGGLYCSTFGGGSRCGILEYSLVSFIYFIWYTVLVSFPLCFLTFVLSFIIQKIRKRR